MLIERYRGQPISFQQSPWYWAERGILAVVTETVRAAPESFSFHGLTHEFAAFGCAYGDPRARVSALRSCVFMGRMQEWQAREFDRPLFVFLDSLPLGDLLAAAHALMEGGLDVGVGGGRPAPPVAPAIPARYPQRPLKSGSAPLPIATVGVATGAEGAGYERLVALMEQLGPRSILVDLREGVDTYAGIKKRKLALPPGEARRVHPVELRGRYGMKYLHLPKVQYFARCEEFEGRAPRGVVKTWLYRPAQCDSLLERVEQGYPLLLLDEQASYTYSLRRAIAVHLLTLFAHLSPREPH